MNGDKSPQKAENAPEKADIVFEVKNNADGERLISVLQQQFSMSQTTSPIMLGFVLTNEKLRREFAEHIPDFYTDVFAKMNAEADARIKLMSNGPEIAKKAYGFANRGQFIALFVTLCALAAAVYFAHAGAHTSAGWVGVAALAPGLVSAYINRESKKNAQQDEPKPEPVKDKGRE